MDSLVAVGSSAAVIYGVFAIFMISYGIGNGNLQLAEKILVGTVFRVGRHDTHAGDGRKIVGGAL